MDLNSIGNLIITLIGTSTFGSLIAGIIANRKNRYDKKIDYLTKNRDEWRNEIKKVYQKLQECSSLTDSTNEIDEIILHLQRVLNPNGFLYRHVYDFDGHIWNELDKLKKVENEEQFQNKKQTLLLELDFLLQEDLEKSRNEVLGKAFNARSAVVMLLLAVLHSFFFFGVREEVNLFLFILEVGLLTIYGFFIPNTMVLSVASKAKNRKDKTIKANINIKKISKIGKVIDVISSLILVFVVYIFLFLLAVSSQIVRMSNDVNEEEGTCLQKKILVEYEKELGQYENVVFDKENVYIKVVVKEVLRNFWGYVLCYFIITFFYALAIFTKKRGELEYKEKVIRAQLLGNNFYVREIKELILFFERKIEEEEKVDLELEMILRIIYIKLDEICAYLRESNYSRKQFLESYEDVRKEVALEQVYKDISLCLKEFGKNGNKLLKKKKNVTLVKDFLEQLKNLKLERLC